MINADRIAQYQTISMFLFIASALLLLCAIYMFFSFDIFHVIDRKTGHEAKRERERFKKREREIVQQTKVQEVDIKNFSDELSTGDLNHSNELGKSKELKDDNYSSELGKSNELSSEEENGSYETETGVLSHKEDILEISSEDISDAEEETGVLSGVSAKDASGNALSVDEEETGLLAGREPIKKPETQTGKFVIVGKIIETHERDAA